MIEPFKDKTLKRLKRAKGQLEGIIKMVEEGKYCVDIIIQLLALEGALKGVSILVLESHLNSCGYNLSSKDPAVKQKFIKELVRITDLSKR